eukprot:GFKZ01011089.1.p1 GENE.GFKZ01011089.1~~GFKZ01011089.1.p1  ORF type:complete len:628 (-),score=83.36 GFKZ01011089.1:402-2285(-)
MYASSTSRKRKISEQVVPGIGSSTAHPNPASNSVFSLHAGDPFANSDYPIPDFQRVYNRMRDPSNGLKLADRRWRLISYTKCFVGSEAVQWMVDNLDLDTSAAVATGQRLMDAGVIHHVTHSEPFSNQYYFYRFQEDDESNILNMKRVWDSSIPARHAVDVAKDLLTRLALLCEEHRKHILATKDSVNPTSSPRPRQTKSNPSTPSLPEHPAAVATGRFLSAVSPSLARTMTAPLPAPVHLSSPLLSTPLFHRMASSPALPMAPFYTVDDDIDYSALAKSELFRQYNLAAAELQRVHLVALNHDERIAFFVNCYNLLCLHAHVVHGPPNSLLRRWSFFRILSYRIAGLDMTLDDIEHGILRGNKRPPMLRFVQQLRPSDPKCQQVLSKRDGRIHFVISAGTRSDPPIRILDGDNVQEELHEATVEFLSYSVKVDTERRVVTLPRIFLWYGEDFATPDKNLLTWVAQYLPVETSQQLLKLMSQSDAVPTIEHENFDWTNTKASFNASVVRRKRRKLERERTSAFFAGPEQDGLDLQLQHNGASPFIQENLFPVSDTPVVTEMGLHGGLGESNGGGSKVLEALFASDGGAAPVTAHSTSKSRTSGTDTARETEPTSEEVQQTETADSNA